MLGTFGAGKGSSISRVSGLRAGFRVARRDDERDMVKRQGVKNLRLGGRRPTDRKPAGRTVAYFFSAPLTASLNALPAANLTGLAAGILISAPVVGLRPVRAARFPGLKLPKPIHFTGSAP